jgi:hypothetical protein
MTADPELLGPAMIDLQNAVRNLSQLVNQMSHNESVPQPTTEEFEAATTLLTAATDAATIVEANTAAAT